MTTDLKDPSLFINRELGLLSFQERVLEEAEDERNPLLERVKFFAIFSSNMAEFYMVRVAGLKQQVAAGVSELSPDGLTPLEQLDAVRDGSAELLRRGRVAFQGLRCALQAEGIFLHDYDDLDPAQREGAEAYFDEAVFPVLTPLAFDPGRPFPHISNLSLNLAVLIRSSSGEERFARVKIPKALPRLVPVGPPADDVSHSRRQHHFVWIEQLVSARLGALFPGMAIVESHPFRVTRDADMAIQELEADDLLSSIEEGVRRRRFGSVVRVTVSPGMPTFVRDILLENLKVMPQDVITLDPPLGGSDLFALYRLDRPDLKDEPFVPVVPSALEDDEEDQDLFALIREHDIVLHRPFESFEPVVRLIRQAACDPDVLAIKMTLYRVGRNSPIVEALLEAALEGKEVTALVELKARFDEESNIEWARALEAEGVHVVYGLLGLKTHSKIALVVRREGGKIRRYLHAGTGNYNTVTALQYTDLDLLTCDESMADDATALFNYLTGWADACCYQRFLVAPASLRPGFEALIRREMEHAAAGRGGAITFKMNALVDPKMIRLLYEASAVGVKIDLIVRGVCCLKPGVPGVSENITVRSIVGRFLEHTRIFYFENAGDPTCLIGSADLMPRNLDRRVEVLAPVLDPVLIGRLRDEMLATYLADNTAAREMLPDGTWRRVQPSADEAPVHSQALLLALAKGQ
ncbi:MAG: polyphosphate kinase 1 [Coriobacteriia bacterium]